MFERITPLLTGALLLSFAACSDQANTTAPQGKPEAGPPPPTVCHDSLWQEQSNPVSVAAHSSAGVTWFIKNLGTDTLQITAQAALFTGNIDSVHTDNWLPLPGHLNPGTQIDADEVMFAGSAGTGTVGLRLFTSCGKLVFPSYDVNVN